MAEDNQQDMQATEEIHPVADWHLQNLVQLANNAGAEMGITLMVNGTVITGTLIGGKSYFNEFADSFASGWTTLDEDAKQAVRDSMARPADDYGSDKPQGTVSYIHLRNARVQTPTGSMPEGGFLWRGRLSQVSGFFLGSLS